MKNLVKRSLVLITCVFSMKAFSYGTGYSAYPWMKDKRVISLEGTGIIEENGGFGIQGRYTHKLERAVTLDGGIGFSGGARSGRVFVGLDYEIIPDFDKQPRVSIKANFMNAKEGEERKNIIGVSPIVSKGFSFWGFEAFPFLSTPFGVNLNKDSKSYETVFNLNLGVISKVPIDGYTNLTASLEGSIDIKDSFSAVLLSVSFPMN